MEEGKNIVDNTLNVMSDFMGTFDNTMGKVPLYKSGHKFGGLISRFIDRLVDSMPFDGHKD